jgi:hypothetical protein
MRTRIYTEGRQIALFDMDGVPQLGAILSIEGHHWRVVDIEVVYNFHGAAYRLDEVHIDVEESRLRRAKFKQEQTPMRMN